jgi:hypothetical protein
VEHRNADIRPVAGRGASGDDAARFLREMRQLRDDAGLGHAELAARAHFPYDIIRAAEVGPDLPDLPVLCAYVRGCGGTTEEWEERWRSLTRSPSLPVSASRNAGRSDAATAGARIGAVTQVGESPDPSVIIAALNRVAEEMASPGESAAAPAVAQQADDFAPAGDFLPPAGDFLPPAGDSFPPAGDSRPAAAEPFPFPAAAEPLPPAPEPAASPRQPAGWDPIRVSTAWPAIRDTPPPAEPARDATSSAGTGTGVPWDKVPWEAGSSTTGSSTTGLAGPASRPGGAAPGTARMPAAAARAVPARAGSGSAPAAPWTRIAVIVAVLVCVLAVLLAVFA